MHKKKFLAALGISALVLFVTLSIKTSSFAQVQDPNASQFEEIAPDEEVDDPLDEDACVEDPTLCGEPDEPDQTEKPATQNPSTQTQTQTQTQTPTQTETPAPTKPTSTQTKPLVKTQTPTATQTQERSAAVETQEPACSQDAWKCGNWSECISGAKIRPCDLTFDCPSVITPKPAETGNCPIPTASTPIPPSGATQPQQIAAAIPDPAADTDQDGLLDMNDPAPTNPDMNSNGIPDGVDFQSGASVTVPDREEAALQNQATAQAHQLEVGGMSAVEAQITVNKIFKKKKTEIKITKIRKLASTKYNKNIRTNIQDTNGDGISDEVEVTLGLNPAGKAVKGASRAEMKIYNITPQNLGKKITTSIYNGYKLSKKGFSILTSCPAGEMLSLFMTDRKGKETSLQTKRCSDNNKTIFTVNNFASAAGRYIMQVRKVRQIAFLNNATLTSAVNAAAPLSGDDAIVNSEPVMVDVLADTDVPQPTVQKIQNIDVAGLQNIRVTAVSDGKIHITGTTDISTMVIGTFSSAVFTSAILADVDSGAFDIASAQALEAGDHEVTIYATRPDESASSAPVKLAFTIVSTAQAADSGSTSAQATRPVAPETFPYTTILLLGGAALLFIIVGLVVMKKRKTS